MGKLKLFLRPFNFWPDSWKASKSSLILLRYSLCNSQDNDKVIFWDLTGQTSLQLLNHVLLKSGL